MRRTASSGCRASSKSEPVTDWTGLTIHETVRALGEGRVTARTLVDVYLGRIARLNDALGAYLTVAAEPAARRPTRWTNGAGVAIRCGRSKACRSRSRMCSAPEAFVR